jgi:hypothetical protein
LKVVVYVDHEGLRFDEDVIPERVEGVNTDALVWVIGVDEESLDQVRERSLTVDFAVELFWTVLGQLGD